MCHARKIIKKINKKTSKNSKQVRGKAKRVSSMCRDPQVVFLSKWSPLQGLPLMQPHQVSCVCVFLFKEKQILQQINPPKRCVFRNKCLTHGHFNNQKIYMKKKKKRHCPQMINRHCKSFTNMRQCKLNQSETSID